ncbi:MAG: biopolymer transporter ExbD [Myxococcales bacterium]|nr:biopolymer transporter ExbD [Myxococcales bacterium]
MAGPVGGDDDDVIASINMVPFIDISLVLLIIFMVTSAYIVRQAIDVDLPRAASGAEVAPSTIAIVVERDGTLSLNGAPTTLEQLEAAVRAEAARDPEVQAIIAGDRTVDYGVIMDVVDAVKLGGARSFALNIEREQ